MADACRTPARVGDGRDPTRGSEPSVRGGLSGSEIVALLGGVPAAALVWAGEQKLRRPFPASVALVRFGVLERVRPGSGRAAGFVEAGAGLSLLAFPLTPWAYVVPALLFAVFVFWLSRALLRHERFSCACFGSHEQRPISVWTLTRAIALLALSVGSLSWVALAKTPGLSAMTQIDAIAAVAALLALLYLLSTISATNPFQEAKSP